MQDSWGLEDESRWLCLPCPGSARAGDDDRTRQVPGVSSVGGAVLGEKRSRANNAMATVMAMDLQLIRIRFSSSFPLAADHDTGSAEKSLEGSAAGGDVYQEQEGPRHTSASRSGRASTVWASKREREAQSQRCRSSRSSQSSQSSHSAAQFAGGIISVHDFGDLPGPG